MKGFFYWKLSFRRVFLLLFVGISIFVEFCYRCLFRGSLNDIGLSQKRVLLENQNAFEKMPVYPFDQQPCGVVCYT